ncbi:pentapeptide repeat-containing protein [Paenarthrobacter sp. FR1]|uniref:pentapeptide repeat-containing protein n=1 Tax=Paenarthrobacter sp. FR1 TaxID=3439548 RepID=UPI003DA57ED4
MLPVPSTAKFQCCQFQGCHCRGCQFQGCQFQGCRFHRWLAARRGSARRVCPRPGRWRKQGRPPQRVAGIRTSNQTCCRPSVWELWGLWEQPVCGWVLLLRGQQRGPAFQHAP